MLINFVVCTRGSFKQTIDLQARNALQLGQQLTEQWQQDLPVFTASPLHS